MEINAKAKVKHVDLQMRIYRAKTGNWEDVTKWKLFKWAIEYKFKRLLKYLGIINKIEGDK